jgi:hypothetical protein
MNGLPSFRRELPGAWAVLLAPALFVSALVLGGPEVHINPVLPPLSWQRVRDRPGLVAGELVGAAGCTLLIAGMEALLLQMVGMAVLGMLGFGSPPNPPENWDMSFDEEDRR